MEEYIYGDKTFNSQWCSVFLFRNKSRCTGGLLPDRNAKPYPHKRRAEIGPLGSGSPTFPLHKLVIHYARLQKALYHSAKVVHVLYSKVPVMGFIEP